ncbi:hypothetical protein EYC84_006361 [Monilinia fructicola]|uniref:Uncharacterized protein n=1 Tax=Monilinia fructicola TaxID=38448 RepID=A0A5M9K335_MONFR|nr:hypothetical protein EYC84_006361 [Monilinia fructicola]
MALDLLRPDGPPLPEINHETDIDELPDQRLQQTMEEYATFTPTVKKRRLQPFTEIGVDGFPLVESTQFNIVRSFSGRSTILRAAGSDLDNIEFLLPRRGLVRLWELGILAAGESAAPHICQPRAREQRPPAQRPTRGHPAGYGGLVWHLPGGVYLSARRAGDKAERSHPDQAAKHFAPTLRGDFNRPHKFIRLSIGTMPENMKQYPNSKQMSIWQIYEPMMPNLTLPARPSDFRYVRPSLENTKASLPEDISEEEGNGYVHPWRRIYGDKPVIPAPLTHPPRWPKGIPNCGSGDINIALGCTYSEESQGSKG